MCYCTGTGIVLEYLKKFKTYFELACNYITCFDKTTQ